MFKSIIKFFSNLCRPQLGYVPGKICHTNPDPTSPPPVDKERPPYKIHNIHEGRVRKGGVNPPATTPKPKYRPPASNTGRRCKFCGIKSSKILFRLCDNCEIKLMV